MTATLRTVERDGDRLPCHLVASAGDRRSICGERDPLPVVLARHASAHADGYDPLFCSPCVARWVTGPST